MESVSADKKTWTPSTQQDPCCGYDMWEDDLSPLKILNENNKTIHDSFEQN